ncbi:MAG: hypothetical protein JSW35_00930 [Deltaproteobacteria bacterium]|nr:MAG: hypothetical protein JSW35_00930 [Deltaproteobacteria bacterium]
MGEIFPLVLTLVAYPAYILLANHVSPEGIANDVRDQQYIVLAITPYVPHQGGRNISLVIVVWEV